MAELPLKGHVALVTGGAKRIGRSIVLRLAADGADVVIVYENSKREAEELASQIQAGGTRALALQADVSRKTDVERILDRVAKEWGRLSILVNNAGVFFPAEFESLTEEQWDRILGTNLKAAFLCSQAAVPLLRKSGAGQIINISSLGGFLPWPQYTHYCVSKAGVIMLTRCLARALAPEIRVNSVAPGTIQFEGEALDEAYIQRAPLHRTGTGDDIAGAVAYLIGAKFVTGQIIAVDGGRILT